jgi:hypothetical protein
MTGFDYLVRHVRLPAPNRQPRKAMLASYCGVVARTQGGALARIPFPFSPLLPRLERGNNNNNNNNNNNSHATRPLQRRHYRASCLSHTRCYLANFISM